MDEFNNPLHFSVEEGQLTFASLFSFVAYAIDELYKRYPKGYIDIVNFLEQTTAFRRPMIMQITVRLMMRRTTWKDKLPHLMLVMDWNNAEDRKLLTYLIFDLAHSTSYTKLSFVTCAEAMKAWVTNKVFNNEQF